MNRIYEYSKSTHYFLFFVRTQLTTSTSNWQQENSKAIQIFKFIDDEVFGFNILQYNNMDIYIYQNDNMRIQML